MNEKIEYEKITIEVPKAVMDFLRYIETITGDTPEHDIEWNIVENVRARADSDLYVKAPKTPKELVDQFNLNPVFQTILGGITTQ